MAKPTRPTYRPGDPAPVSGLYPLQGPRGGNQGVQVTVVQGRPLPPTPHSGMGYGKPTPAKHEK
jgi:hypothetical protein